MLQLHDYIDVELKLPTSLFKKSCPLGSNDHKAQYHQNSQQNYSSCFQYFI